MNEITDLAKYLSRFFEEYLVYGFSSPFFHTNILKSI